MNFSADIAEKIYQLWDEIESYPPNEASAANVKLMETLADWLRADYVYWIAGIRMMSGKPAASDPMDGWRTCVVEPLRLPPTYETDLKYLMKNQHVADTVAQATAAIVHEAGAFRVRRLRELVDVKQLDACENFQQYDMPYGLSDRLYVVTPLNDDGESYFCFERAGSDSRFTDEDAALAGAALRGVRWFQRRLFLSHGLLVGNELLTPMERSVALLLLTKKSEQEIADEIGRAHATIHNHITGVYRKFGVSKRAEFMALWLG
jgi:DNA-binding CsgD family transcriptional regulator